MFRSRYCSSLEAMFRLFFLIKTWESLTVAKITLCLVIINLILDKAYFDLSHIISQ